MNIEQAMEPNPFDSTTYTTSRSVKSNDPGEHAVVYAHDGCYTVKVYQDGELTYGVTVPQERALSGDRPGWLAEYILNIRNYT